MKRATMVGVPHSAPEHDLIEAARTAMERLRRRRRLRQHRQSLNADTPDTPVLDAPSPTPVLVSDHSPVADVAPMVDAEQPVARAVAPPATTRPTPRTDKPRRRVTPQPVLRRSGSIDTRFVHPVETIGEAAREQTARGDYAGVGSASTRVYLPPHALPPTQSLLAGTSKLEKTPDDDAAVRRAQPWLLWIVPQSVTDQTPEGSISAYRGRGTRILLLYSKLVGGGGSGLVFVGRQTFVPSNAPMRAVEQEVQTLLADVTRTTHMPLARDRTIATKYAARWVAVKLFPVGAEHVYVAESRKLHQVRTVSAGQSPFVVRILDQFRVRRAHASKYAFDRFTAVPDALYRKTRDEKLKNWNGGAIVLDFGEVAASLNHVADGITLKSVLSTGVAPIVDGAAAAEGARYERADAYGEDQCVVGAGFVSGYGYVRPMKHLRFEQNALTVPAGDNGVYSRLGDGFDYVALAFQLMYAVRALHGIDRLHGDIKPGNVVLREVPEDYKLRDVVFAVERDAVYAVPYRQPVMAVQGAVRRLGHTMSMAVMPLLIDLSTSVEGREQRVDGQLRLDVRAPITSLSTRALRWTLATTTKDHRFVYTEADDVFSMGMTLLYTFMRIGDGVLALKDHTALVSTLNSLSDNEDLYKKVHDKVYAWFNEMLTASNHAKIWRDFLGRFVPYAIDSRGEARDLTRWIIPDISAVIVLLVALRREPVQNVVRVVEHRDDLLLVNAVNELAQRLATVMTDPSRMHEKLHDRIASTLSAHPHMVTAVNGEIADLYSAPELAMPAKQLSSDGSPQTHSRAVVNMLQDMVQPAAGQTMAGVLRRWGSPVFYALSVDAKDYFASRALHAGYVAEWSTTEE